jgi:hypothetical protein
MAPFDAALPGSLPVRPSSLLLPHTLWPDVLRIFRR